MSMGERIKLARSLVGLTLRDLSVKVGVSYQAISKYEHDLDVPSSGVLLRLAEALGVKLEFFFRPSDVTLGVTAHYRKRSRLTQTNQQAIMAKVQEWVERYFEVENIVLPEPPTTFAFPGTLDRRVDSPEDAERVAEGLRSAWQLGLDPIDNLIELLEDKGIKVGLVNGPDDFDAFTFVANDMPVIAVKDGLPGDRQRFNLAHELGHLVLEPSNAMDEEKAAHRFAAALLVPAQAAYHELGPTRHHLHLKELHMLKLKYGLSMQGWVLRAKDLGILSEQAAQDLFRTFRAKGFHKREPGDQLPPEQPTRMERLVMKALAENLISYPRASELLHKPLEQVEQF